MSDDIERLKAERSQIVVEIRRLQDSMRSEVERDLEEGDPALYEREKNLALLQNLERELGAVEYALSLAEKGVYGICENCGERIDPARLKAIPHATLCLKCKREVERRGRRGI
jgi:DnaK suppressor protein